MENSFRFYSNKDCIYFPCHDLKKENEFNCMFCYCPLYLLDDCKGNYKIFNGIKDCSDCMIPHNPNGYDHVNKMLSEEIVRRQKEYLENKD